MKKICLIVSILLLSFLMAFSVGAKCASGCVYSTSPFCDVCGEQIEGECTGSHVFESGYCVICGAFDDSQEDWCPVSQGQHNVLFGSCTHCGKVFCYHTDMSGLHVVTEATCKEVGYGYRLCLDCGAEYGESIPQKEHDYKDGVCVNCGADSFGVCSHKLSDWMDDENNSTMCGDEYWMFRECSLCGFKEWKGGINSHSFVNGKCEVCGILDSSHNHFAYRVVILNENQHMYLCACGEPYSAAESHFWEEQNRTSSVANHLPMSKTVVCSDCGFECVQFFVNPILNTHTLINGERLTYSTLSSFDCLCYEYTSNNAGACVISVVNGAGAATKITLPTLSKGEKLLVDTKTGFYSIWSDAVSKEKILVDSKYVTDNGGYYYQFAPIVESVPNPLDRVNAYFESERLDRYDYPDNDKSKGGTGFNRPYPGTGRGSANNIMLISFPFETLQDIKNSLDNYPLYLVLYDGTNVDIKSVTSVSDPFIASYVALMGNNGGTNGGSHNGCIGDMGGSYAQGFADAYNTLTNAVIEKAPIQGLVQGMWYGVLAMVTILGNGISISGISLFSVLVSVLILCAGYLLLKVIRK